MLIYIAILLYTVVGLFGFGGYRNVQRQDNRQQ